jgi:hypothetical protein
METIAASAVVATLLLEAIKLLIRRVYGNLQFNFSSKFYVVAIPVLNVAVVPLLALVGFEGYTMPTDWQGWVLGIVRVAIGSLATLVGYSAGLKPLKDYARSE